MDDALVERVARKLHACLNTEEDFDKPDHPATVKLCFDMAEIALEEAAKVADEQVLYPASGWSANDADFWECGGADMQRAIAIAIRSKGAGEC